MQHKRLWIGLGLVMLASFGVLGFEGVRLHRELPPIPSRVLSTDQKVLFDAETIQNGQNVWQSLGGQQVGSIWGHGAYVAPDWTADWLHRESVFILEAWAREQGAPAFDRVDPESQAALKTRLNG